MVTRKGKKMRLSSGVFCFQIIVLVVSLICYVGNVIRLVKCDFEPSYKAEILYGAGLFVPTFYITVFMDLEK